MLIVGYLCWTLGGAIAVVNIYLSWLRYPLHRLRGGTREDFRWASGIPLLGSLFIVPGIILLREHTVLFWIGITLACADTGAPHWLLLPRR